MENHFIFVFNEKFFENDKSLGLLYNFPDPDRGSLKLKGKSKGSWSRIIESVNIGSKIIWMISGNSRRNDKKTFWGQGEIVSIDYSKKLWKLESIEFENKVKLDEVVLELPYEYQKLFLFKQSNSGEYFSVGYFGTIQIDKFLYNFIKEYCSKPKLDLNKYDKYIERAINDKHIRIGDQKKFIYYNTLNGIKSFSYNKFEESVRRKFYSELIYRYRYSPKKIGLEIRVPKETVYSSDLVVYEDQFGNHPYILAEFKNEGISESEIKNTIEQLFKYNKWLGAKYLILIAGSVRIAFDALNFPSSEREKNIISDIPHNYGTISKFIFKKGGQYTEFGINEKDLEVLSQDQILSKFKQCIDIIWEGGKRDLLESLEEVIKLLFYKILDEKYLTIDGDYYKFQIGTNETKKTLKNRIRDIYIKSREVDSDFDLEYSNLENNLIYSLIQIFQDFSLTRTEPKSKGMAFESLLTDIFKEYKSVYFTPRNIIKLIVKILEPKISDFILDPACGTGGFLVEIINYIKGSLLEGGENNQAIENFEEFIQHNLWGIENEFRIYKIALMNLLLNNIDYLNIENRDALEEPSIFKKHDLSVDFKKYFDLILLDPPIGIEIRANEKQYLNLFALATNHPSQKSEILFLEKSLNFLKPNGRLAIILPDTILSNINFQYVRDYILKNTQILAIISLPSNEQTKSFNIINESILILRKKRENEVLPVGYPIFMAEIQDFELEIGRLSSELLAIFNDWSNFKEEFLNKDFTIKEVN